MKSIFRFFKTQVYQRAYLRSLTTATAKSKAMASSLPESAHNVFIPHDVVPTATTKVKLADKVLISPLSECQRSCAWFDASSVCEWQFLARGRGERRNNGIGTKS